jgi:hypothetical protein
VVQWFAAQGNSTDVREPESGIAHRLIQAAPSVWMNCFTPSLPVRPSQSEPPSRSTHVNVEERAAGTLSDFPFCDELKRAGVRGEFKLVTHRHVSRRFCSMKSILKSTSPVLSAKKAIREQKAQQRQFGQSLGRIEPKRAEVECSSLPTNTPVN